MDRVLDWRPAEDRTHEVKWSFSAITPTTVAKVEKRIYLPYWHWTHDQGAEGSCVGHGVGMERALSNILQATKTGVKPFNRRYDTIDIWNRGKELDEWPDTNPGDQNGTSVHAGYDVALKLGLIPVSKMVLENGIPKPVGSKPRDLNAGVSAVRWVKSVDEVRTAISQNIPVTIGINWYSNFDNPVSQNGYQFPFIGLGNLGTVRGGHCVCIYGASDSRQAVAVKNSWGRSYPRVWLDYKALERVMGEDGEIAVATDL